MFRKHHGRDPGIETPVPHLTHDHLIPPNPAEVANQNRETAPLELPVAMLGSIAIEWQVNKS